MCMFTWLFLMRDNENKKQKKSEMQQEQVLTEQKQGNWNRNTDENMICINIRGTKTIFSSNVEDKNFIFFFMVYAKKMTFLIFCDCILLASYQNAESIFCWSIFELSSIVTDNSFDPILRSGSIPCWTHWLWCWLRLAMYFSLNWGRAGPHSGSGWISFFIRWKNKMKIYLCIMKMK